MIERMKQRRHERVQNRMNNSMRVLGSIGKEPKTMRNEGSEFKF